MTLPLVFTRVYQSLWQCELIYKIRMSKSDNRPWDVMFLLGDFITSYFGSSVVKMSNLCSRFYNQWLLHVCFQVSSLSVTETDLCCKKNMWEFSVFMWSCSGYWTPELRDLKSFRDIRKAKDVMHMDNILSYSFLVCRRRWYRPAVSNTPMN